MVMVKIVISSHITEYQFTYFDEKNVYSHKFGCMGMEIPYHLRLIGERYKHHQVTFICDSTKIHEQCKKYGYSIFTSNFFKEKME